MEIKLSKTSKMNCNSWSTQALDTCPRGAELANVAGSICENCYACSGMYRFPVVKARRIENYAQWKDNREGWIMAMTQKIRRTRNPLFRFFDSGDLTSVQQLDDIIKVCVACPTKKFWIPTREHITVQDWIDKGNTIPSNVNIRISADMIDDTETSLLSMAKSVGGTTSRVLTEPTTNKTEVICHATVDGTGECKDCQACWNKEIDTIVYKAHSLNK